MAINFWISIPTEDFFHYSNDLMKKYNVSAYIERIEFGTFYTPEIAPFTIEGNGGVETEKTREQIHLIQIQKQPDKNIQRFYSALQRKLINIPGIQNSYVMDKHEYKNCYCLPTSKLIIPNNPHSRNMTDSWENYYLNSIGH